ARRVAEEIAKLELQVNEEDRRKVFGNRVLAENSEASYYVHYRGLKHFCALIGDYKSLILLGDCIPKYAPSMLARTIVRYMDWKTGEEGSALLDVNGASVVDVDGNAVVCDGQWKNPGTLVQFLAAVSNAHKAAGMDGVAYAEPCDQCVDLYETRGSVRGCRHHAGRPVLNQCGNVRFSQDVMDAYARLSKVVLRGYVPHGDSMVSPKELMDLRNVLMGTGRIKDIRLWTMILFSVRLFCRPDRQLGHESSCSRGLVGRSGLQNISPAGVRASPQSAVDDDEFWGGCVDTLRTDAPVTRVGLRVACNGRRRTSLDHRGA
ncbi:hypothetical protein PBRA_008592, partial [Plasmodiophora brassicae]